MGVWRPWHRRRWVRGQQESSSRATQMTFYTSSVSSEADTVSALDYSASQMYVSILIPRQLLTAYNSFGNPALYANQLNASRTPLGPIQRSVLLPPFNSPNSRIPLSNGQTSLETNGSNIQPASASSSVDKGETTCAANET